MGLMTARPSSAKFVVEDPCFLDADQCLDWQSQFGNNHPLKLEIGFGMGDFLIAMALRESQSNFVGIDFSQNGIQKIFELSMEMCGKKFLFYSRMENWTRFISTSPTRGREKGILNED